MDNYEKVEVAPAQGANPISVIGAYLLMILLSILLIMYGWNWGVLVLFPTLAYMTFKTAFWVTLFIRAIFALK